MTTEHKDRRAAPSASLLDLSDVQLAVVLKRPNLANVLVEPTGEWIPTAFNSGLMSPPDGD